MKNQFGKLFISFFLVILLLCSCAPSRTPSEGGKQAREGKPKSSQAETEEKLLDYLQKLIENLNESSTIFVAVNNGSGDLVAIDPSTGKVARLSAFPEEIINLALKPDGTELYVTSGKAKKVYIFDLKANKIVKTINFKDEPYSVAFLPDGTKAYVTNYSSDLVSIIDTKKTEIVKTIKVGKHPTTIVITYDGRKAFVGHGMFVDFSRQKTMKIRGITVPVGLPSFSEGSKEVTVIDLDEDEVKAHLSINGFCNGLAVRPDNSLVYAAISSVDVSGVLSGNIKKGKEDLILAIDTDTNKLVGKIKFESGSGPKAVAFTPDSKKAYAICGTRDDATVIDAQEHKIIKKIPLKLGG